jgi:hypothetical protein
LIWNEWFIFIFIDIYGETFLREDWFEMSDLFSSLLIFTIIKTILSTFFFTVSKFYKHLVKWAWTEIEWSVAGSTTLDREWFTIICQNLKDVYIVLFYWRESIYRWNGITFGLISNIYKQTTSTEVESVYSWNKWF